MDKFNLPFFGQINPSDLNSLYQGEITLNGKIILSDINFEDNVTNITTLEKINNIIENLSSQNSTALTYIKKDYYNEGEVKDYIKHHLEFSENVSKENILEKELEMLNKVHLARIGFYPDNELEFAVFDYTIGEDLTDYLIVVNFQKNGGFHSLTIES